MTRRLLIVDDDPTIRTSLAEALADNGMTEVRVAEGPHRALAMLDVAAPDVVLSDVRMPDMDGIAFLKVLHERAPSVDVILMTAYDDMPTVVAAMREGAVEFLVKPLDLHQVRRVLDATFEDRKSRARAPLAPATELALGDLAGRDPGMIAVYKLIGQAATTRATVLIRGESGTGKELVARAIHSNSVAAAEPFVPVNCAALPTPLLESELFGHIRGAFTGAVNARKGARRREGHRQVRLMDRYAWLHLIQGLHGGPWRSWRFQISGPGPQHETSDEQQCANSYKSPHVVLPFMSSVSRTGPQPLG